MDPDTRPPNPADSPIKQLGSKQCLMEFDEKFAEARRETGYRVISFDFRWINEDNYEYEIEIIVGNENERQHFFVKLKPYLTRTFLCQHVVKTKAWFVQKKFSGQTENPGKDFGVEEYPDVCDTTASKMLNHFAMINKYVIKNVDIVLPREIAQFPNLRRWHPENLTVTVHESIKDEEFIGKWLAFMLEDGVAHLTINSKHHPINFRSNSEAGKHLKEVRNLTINAEARIDVELLLKYPNLKVVYNDENRTSPIDLNGFLRYWEKNKDELGKHRRIEFRCIHPHRDLKGSKEKAMLTIVEGIRGETGIVDSENQHNIRRLFDITEHRLLIDINTTGELNNGSETNRTQ